MSDAVPRSQRVEHRLVQPPGERPVMQDAGGAIARLPRAERIADDVLVWLLVNGCGCAWGWVRASEYGSTTLARRLVRADQVADEMRHTAVHHLLAGGFSQAHVPAPGCSR